jgi:chemotaxis family two-component system response regulator Rcp1
MDLESEGKTADILLVEDNPADVRLIQETLKEGKIRVNLLTAEDGIAAMKILRNQDEYADAPQPDIILLDLNLPKRSGRELLGEIKADAKLKQIPVIVLTSSSAEQDIAKAYNLHANCYITKPVGLDEFIDSVRSIEDFWLKLVKLPEGARYE